MSSRTFVIVLIVLALVGAYKLSTRVTPIPFSPGTRAAAAPVQKDPANTAPWTHNDFTIEPLADFSLSALVLSREDYAFGTEAELSPTDLALGWGRMSDGNVLAGLSISQGNRWYYYRWGAEGPPIPQQEIVVSSANMHMIPANATVAAALARVRPGQIVDLRGKLVAIARGDGWRWQSSTTREDSGNGSCEVVWVEALTAR